jgi:hypothetical protein
MSQLDEPGLAPLSDEYLSELFESEQYACGVNL